MREVAPARETLRAAAGPRAGRAAARGSAGLKAPAVRVRRTPIPAALGSAARLSRVDGESSQSPVAFAPAPETSGRRTQTTRPPRDGGRATGPRLEQS